MAAERDQGECDQRFRLVAGASLDGFWDFDVTGNVAHYSPRWQAIAGFEPYELAGDLVHWAGAGASGGSSSLRGGAEGAKSAQIEKGCAKSIRCATSMDRGAGWRCVG